MPTAFSDPKFDSARPAPPPPSFDVWRCDPLIGEGLSIIEKHLPCRRQIVYPGQTIHSVGQPFSNLHIVHSGLIKLLHFSQDGRQQVVALRFKGDWLGFDGMADQQHTCEAVALDISEIWTVSYAAVLAASQDHPAVLSALHKAISEDMTGMQERFMSHCTLHADARVAEFLLQWSSSLAKRGLHPDQFRLRLSREEIGSYLGITLESVSRSISLLVREGLIGFHGKGRRDLKILGTEALAEFVEAGLTSATEA
ncbi:MAG: Crp/Fnr family transcriptional regulator [Aquabacterium sp.]|uniref:Crp/Fnr family transcriptional regulator n=1 Tax=Aquabacterium sp. TaxID=1872578 RepID=UPI002728ECD4|nr:Crp/Fnr family transcriptional regulator [Aquabacterium sp.]MDO9004226.1 Crp/Fnr family transcriptional regulator [Aquabacterium sp.]